MHVLIVLCFYRSGIASLDSAKIRVENCEFARGGGGTGQAISAGASDLNVKGCYLHHQHPAVADDDDDDRPAVVLHSNAAIAVTAKSVANISLSYVFGGSKGGNGISVADSDAIVKHNLIINCSSQSTALSAAVASSVTFQACFSNGNVDIFWVLLLRLWIFSDKCHEGETRIYVHEKTLWVRGTSGYTIHMP